MNQTIKSLFVSNKTQLVFSGKGESGAYRLYYTQDLETWTLLPSVGNGNCITPCFSPDGNSLLYAEELSGGFQLVHLDIATRQVRALTAEGKHSYAPAWANNMGHIVWSQVPEMCIERANEAEVMLSTWPNFNPRQLTFNGRMEAYPTFASDSQSIIVEAGQIGSFFGLFRISLSGQEDALIYAPEKSGNGIPHVFEEKVVFERTLKQSNFTKFDIYMMSIKNKKLTRLTRWYTRCNPTPRFSPCGNLICCHRFDKKGQSFIVVLSPEGVAHKRLKNKTLSLKLPKWDKTGRLIAAEDYLKKSLILFDLNGNQYSFNGTCPYRGQQLLEIYNYDIC